MDQRKQTKKKQTDKKQTGGKKSAGKKNTNVLLFAGAAVLLCAAIGITVAGGQNKKADETEKSAKPAEEAVYSEAENLSSDDAAVVSDSPAADSDEKDVQVIEEGESLVIPVGDISSTASFYTVEVDGMEMEVLAVMDSEGNIRTAFNTCQVCYGSGRGYYVQDGDVLVCQNCGNRFTVDHVEIESGGCNPWPIFPENKTVTDETIEISYDFLKESREIFENWKIQY